MKRRDVPFQRHWLYYVILKYAVIAVARRRIGDLRTPRSLDSIRG